MTTTMELTAASIGYLLTAALAGQRYDEAAGLWRELDESTQAEVITGLGALAEIHVKAGVAGGMPAYYVELVCRSAATS